MLCEVLSRVEMPIEREDDVVLVRRRVRALAAQQKLDSFATAAITTAASELTRNVWVHAGKGVAILEEVVSGGRAGIRATFRDEGGGIADLERVLQGGYSTALSMGLGLSGVFVVTRAITVPTDLYGSASVRFIVPAGIAAPVDPGSHNSYYTIENGQCRGVSPCS